MRDQEIVGLMEAYSSIYSQSEDCDIVSEARAMSHSVDIFDVILEHLVAEGFADTEEAAVVIMANMSEEWRQSIVEQNVITRTGTSTNAAGEKIKWTHNHDKSTGRSTVTDKYGTRDSTPVKRAQGPRLTRLD